MLENKQQLTEAASARAVKASAQVKDVGLAVTLLAHRSKAGFRPREVLYVRVSSRIDVVADRVTDIVVGVGTWEYCVSVDLAVVADLGVALQSAHCFKADRRTSHDNFSS